MKSESIRYPRVAVPPPHCTRGVPDTSSLGLSVHQSGSCPHRSQVTRMNEAHSGQRTMRIRDIIENSIRRRRHLGIILAGRSPAIRCRIPKSCCDLPMEIRNPRTTLVVPRGPLLQHRWSATGGKPLFDPSRWLRSSHVLRCAPWPWRCQVGTGKQVRRSNRKAGFVRLPPG